MGSFFPVSRITRILTALGLSNVTASAHTNTTGATATLPVAGAGYAADATTQQATDSTNGVYLFDATECMGLELHFTLKGLAGVTGSARVFRELIVPGNTNDNAVQVTYRHLCDISLVASSAQTGIGSTNVGVGVTYRWAVPTVTADAGLTPNGTRVLQGTTTGAAGSVVIDPMCASRVMVCLIVGTADLAGVYASKWTGL